MSKSKVCNSSPLVDPFTLPAVVISADHGGEGPIEFRRLFDRDDFDGRANFVDITTIPPGSTIGDHCHHDTFELYVVLSGEPLLTVDGQSARLGRGGLALVRPGGRHSLINDQEESVLICVIELSREYAHNDR